MCQLPFSVFTVFLCVWLACLSILMHFWRNGDIFHKVYFCLFFAGMENFYGGDRASSRGKVKNRMMMYSWSPLTVFRILSRVSVPFWLLKTFSFLFVLTQTFFSRENDFLMHIHSFFLEFTKCILRKSLFFSYFRLRDHASHSKSVARNAAWQLMFQEHTTKLPTL